MESQKKRKTCRRYNNPRHTHCLTFSCFRRQPFLMRDRVRYWLIDAIELARRKHQLHLWEYVIMPEHVHLLIYPCTDVYSISRILSTLKQSVSKRAVLFVEGQAPEFQTCMTDTQPNGKTELRFWQRGGGYDRNLWSPKHIWETIDYIHANPVRRGLCSVDTDWSGPARQPMPQVHTRRSPLTSTRSPVILGRSMPSAEPRHGHASVDHATRLVLR